jgi:hypothetical protein
MVVGQRAVVTSFGLEPLSNEHHSQSEIERRERYKIPADNLLEYHGFATVYWWPSEISRDRSIDLDAFEEAFRMAITKHRLVPDDSLLDQSFDNARQTRLALG